ncbi:hypothetical protein AB0N18_22730, partial [Streptomyces griseoincarnatus]
GGNPVACAAGLAVLDTIAGEGLLENAKRQGERFDVGRGPGGAERAVPHAPEGAPWRGVPTGRGAGKA